VIRRIGIKHTRIRELEDQGKYPKRIKISDRANGWIESEIEAWIDQRVAASRS
jgi:prophage regulatory protein